MNKNKNNLYPPHLRSFYKPEKHDLVSSSPKGVKTKLPNPVEDDIVANNITNAEFDYTEQ